MYFIYTNMRNWGSILLFHNERPFTPEILDLSFSFDYLSQFPSVLSKGFRSLPFSSIKITCPFHARFGHIVEE